jgi:PAS domain S-box-containing protein
MFPAIRAPATPYALAVGAVLLAAAARGAVNPLVEDRVPFATFYVALVAVAFFGNLGAALLATALSAAAGFYFFTPRSGFAPQSPPDLLSVALFVITGAMVALLAHSISKTRERMRATAEAATAQHRLAQTDRRRLRDLVESIPGVVWEAWGEPDSSRQQMNFVSEYVHKMLGYTPDEWTAQPNFWLQLVAPEDREAAARVASETFASGGSGENEFRWITKDGRRIWVLARSSVIKDESGSPAGMRGVTFDITDRKEVEQRLEALALDNARLFATAHNEAAEARKARAEAEAAGRAKDEFLATLSHELRTPLNAILGWAHMLRDPALPIERRQAAVETIVRNAQSQEQLIADILDVQRIMAGKIRLTPRHVDLGNIIRAAAETVQPTADAKGIRLQLLIDLAAPPAWGDPDRLQQVVWNLLSNAIKFAPKGGRVNVRLLKENGHHELVVEDNGPGINPEFIPFMFERFRQADSSTTRTHKGLGLGLAIVRTLVEMHGGTITAANAAEPERTGAVFTIRLPRQVARATVPPADAPSLGGDERAWLGATPSLDGVRVLVLDDDGDARDLVRAILERCGAEVALASSAAEGIEAFMRQRPDVVVSDIEMPDEDGFTFIRRLRALGADAGSSVPAAALTAYASTADRMKVLGAGFNIHVPKPVQPAELAMVVASLAGRWVENGLETATDHESEIADPKQTGV